VGYLQPKQGGFTRHWFTQLWAKRFQPLDKTQIEFNSALGHLKSIVNPFWKENDYHGEQDKETFFTIWAMGQAQRFHFVTPEEGL